MSQSIRMFLCRRYLCVVVLLLGSIGSGRAAALPATVKASSTAHSGMAGRVTGRTAQTTGIDQSQKDVGSDHMPAGLTDLALPPAVGSLAARCAGPQDLRIHAGFLKLHGDHSFQSVCITDGGQLILDDTLTLHAGLVLVDASSSISADAPLDPRSGGCEQTGEPAYSLTLEVRVLDLQGSLSANGGDGLPNGCETGGSLDGGDGGKITIFAHSLQVTGHIHATGGDAAEQSGDAGGAGGTVLIASHNVVPQLAAHILVQGGIGDPDAAPQPGVAGTVTIQALDSAQEQLLPPDPPSLLQPLGAPTTRRLPTKSFLGGMTCGSGDLNVGSGQQISVTGTQVYGHVCIHDGGILRTGPRLTLIAQTIQVDAQSRISADGVITPTSTLAATG